MNVDRRAKLTTKCPSSGTNSRERLASSSVQKPMTGRGTCRDRRKLNGQDRDQRDTPAPPHSFKPTVADYGDSRVSAPADRRRVPCWKIRPNYLRKRNVTGSSKGSMTMGLGFGAFRPQYVVTRCCILKSPRPMHRKPLGCPTCRLVCCVRFAGWRTVSRPDERYGRGARVSVAAVETALAAPTVQPTGGGQCRSHLPAASVPPASGPRRHDRCSLGRWR